MNPATGWQVRRTDAPFDPWDASNLEHGVTFHGRDRAEVEREIAGYEAQLFTDARWQVMEGIG